MSKAAFNKSMLVMQGVKPEIAAHIVGQVEAVKAERDLILKKYRTAALALEKIVAFRCDAQKTASTALKRCVDLGDTSGR